MLERKIADKEKELQKLDEYEQLFSNVICVRDQDTCKVVDMMIGSCINEIFIHR
jgi:hypothetical protein